MSNCELNKHLQEVHHVQQIDIRTFPHPFRCFRISVEAFVQADVDKDKQLRIDEFTVFTAPEN